MVCLHGLFDTWRVWELVLPRLERRRDVLALTLPGHAGGPPLGDEADAGALANELERAMDRLGWPTAHLVGNSLGGYLALELAVRGRAESVVALAPAGGWAPDDDSYRELLRFQLTLYEQSRRAAPHAEAILSTLQGRRRATDLITVNYEHIPAELLAHQLIGMAACAGAEALIEQGLGDRWSLDAERVACPVRVIWGTADRLLAWPGAAARYREWLPHADWVVLDDVGHCPQLDVPLETAELILGFGPD
jgi:pimeloyl-ACP methyl ester carboxylesterase